MNSETPKTARLQPRSISVFLAGSIEMGTAEDWQSQVITALADLKNIQIFNPRRDDWDSTWVQRESNSEFNHQVNWELSHLETADVIFLNFCKDTKSPISLMELGLFARHRKMVVVCPSEFWRRGNVQIVCTRFGIPLFETLEDGIGGLRTMIYSVSANR